jgi:hypothetical protein
LCIRQSNSSKSKRFNQWQLWSMREEGGHAKELSPSSIGNI